MGCNEVSDYHCVIRFPSKDKPSLVQVTAKRVLISISKKNGKRLLIISMAEIGLLNPMYHRSTSTSKICRRDRNML